MNPHSSSLFHFTKKKSVFKSILKNGLRYSFSFEAFPDSIVNNIFCHGLFPTLYDTENSGKGFAIPMISFCDIPLTRIHSHSKRYGRFAIGINKEYLCHLYEEFINPVLYVESNSVMDAIKHLSRAQGISMKYFCSLIQADKSIDFNKILENISSQKLSINDAIDGFSKEIRELYEYIIECRASITKLLSLTKPTFGINVDGKNQSFYDEHEWRAIFPNLHDTPFEWQVGCYRSEFKNNRDELNSELNNVADAFITIPGEWFNHISHIIVPKEIDIPSISNFIMHSDSLFVYPNIEKHQRVHLMSRITSFERIENDY